MAVAGGEHAAGHDFVEADGGEDFADVAVAFFDGVGFGGECDAHAGASFDGVEAVDADDFFDEVDFAGEVGAPSWNFPLICVDGFAAEAGEDLFHFFVGNVGADECAGAFGAE